jgi:hypothetical protein
MLEWFWIIVLGLFGWSLTVWVIGFGAGFMAA